MTDEVSGSRLTQHGDGDHVLVYANSNQVARVALEDGAQVWLIGSSHGMENGLGMTPF